MAQRSLYLYILVLGNLIAVIGMTFLMLGILGALGLISAITDSLGGLGSGFASATNEAAVLYSYAFLASLLSLAASWKMFHEGPRLWLLGLVIVLQLASAAAFHSGVSVLVAIPLLAAIYGVVVLFRFTPSAALQDRSARGPATAIDSRQEGGTMADHSPRPEARRNCPDCGAGNPAEARVCRSCGSILPGSALGVEESP